MAVPVKWTIDSLGDDPEVEGDLPQPVDITRASLADPAFDVETFLNTHGQYRTLRETQLAVLVWEEKLHAELLSVVNENFRDFVGSASSLQAGGSLLGGIDGDMQRFERQAGRVAESLAKQSRLLERELAHHRRLSESEGQARQLLLMFDLLEDLEAALPELDPEDVESLLSLARSYVAVVTVAEGARDVKAVSALRATIQSVQRELLEALDAGIRGTRASDAKLGLVEARQWVRDSKLAEIV